VKYNELEKYISAALKKELQAFPSPSPNLRNRLFVLTPKRLKKFVWGAAIGFAATTTILLFICVDFHQKPKIVDDYFQPTKTIDLNEMSFEPTKTINLDN
jgi:hypothetical protein